MSKKTLKRLLSIIIISSIAIGFISIIAWSIIVNNPEWIFTWGGPQDEWGHDMVIDSSDNIYIVGDTASYGAGDEDVVLLKLDATGNTLWYKTWGGAQLDNGWGMTQDASTNLFITGRTLSYGAGLNDIIILKYSSSGVLLFNKTWGGVKDDIGHDIVVDSTGYIFIAGETESSGLGESDAIIIKLNSSGQVEWNMTWGGIHEDEARGIVVDSAGNIYVVGTIGYTSKKGYNSDIFLLKINGSGTLLWNQTWSTTKDDYGNGIVLDSTGNLCIVGSSSNSMAIAKYTTDGTKLWEKTVSGHGYGIALDSKSNVLVAGSRSLLDSNIKFNHLDSLGGNTTSWYNIWGYMGSDMANAVSVDSKDNAFILGYSSSIGAGKNDIILIKNFSPRQELSIIVLLIFIVLMECAVIGLLYSYVKPRLKQLKVFDKGAIKDVQVSGEVSRNIGDEETILFKMKHASRGMGVKVNIGMVTVAIMIMPPMMSSFLLRNLLFDSLFAMMFFLILAMMVMMIFMLRKSLKGKDRSESILILTDRKIYVNTRFGQSESVHALEWQDVKAVTFRKKGKDKEEDVGTIEFIPDQAESWRNPFLIKKVNNFSELQNLIESIIAETLDIDHKWEEITKKLIKLPKEFKISSKMTRDFKRKSFKNKIYILLLLPWLVFGICFTPIALSQESEALMRLFFYVAFLPLGMSTCYIIIFWRKNHKWKKKCCNEAEVLTLRKNDITHGKHAVTSDTINLDKGTVLDYFKFTKSKRMPTKWKKDVDAIIIKPSYNANFQIMFGPVEEFTEMFDVIFTYLLKWKKDKGLLLTKEQIMSLGTKEKISETPSESQMPAKPMKIREKPLKELAFEPLSRTAMVYKELKPQLESNEQIYIIHSPESNIRNGIICCVISIIGFIVSLLTLFSQDYSGWFAFEIAGILGATFGLFLPCCGLACIWTELNKHFMTYILTDRQIIIETRLNICQIPYKNISSIQELKRAKGKKYSIQMNLKTPVDNNPFARKGKHATAFSNICYIQKIFKENPFIDKLKILMDRDKKQRESGSY